MPSTFEKTRKQIQKKRHGNIDALHQLSRDSRRLHKANVRDQRLDKLATSRGKREQPILDRVAFFRDRVKESRASALMQEQINELIQEFVNQYDDELASLKKARRPGRPPTAKEDLLKRKIEALASEHDSGFLIPDLSAEDNIARLDRWEGSWAYLCTLTWVRVSKAGHIRPSVFPPSSGNH